MNGPNPRERFPLAGNTDVQFINNTLDLPNVEVGEYSYYSAENGESFETCILHHYEFLGDKLIIGKFNSFAAGLSIVMNGANHRMSGSTYPFNIFGNGWESVTPALTDLPLKGDTVIENDVWLGSDVTIMPGVTIGSGAIVAAKSVVVKDVLPYTVVGGNPAKLIKQRFSDQEIEQWLEAAWWEWPIELITAHLPEIVAGKSQALLTVKRSL